VIVEYRERPSVSKQIGQKLIMKGYCQEAEVGHCVGWYQFQIVNMCAAFEKLDNSGNVDKAWEISKYLKNLCK
jgi:hypothetical protein